MISRDHILSIASELDPTAGKGIGKNFILKTDDVVELVRRAAPSSVESAEGAKP